MKEVIPFGESMGDPVAIRILALLREGELCICEIQNVLGIDRSKISLRLRKLREAGIVRARPRGQWLAFRVHSRYIDLVETVFEAFDDTLAWDATVDEDARCLAAELRSGVDDWCASPRARLRTAEGVEEDPIADGGLPASADDDCVARLAA